MHVAETRTVVVDSYHVYAAYLHYVVIVVVGMVCQVDQVFSPVGHLPKDTSVKSRRSRDGCNK